MTPSNRKAVTALIPTLLSQALGSTAVFAPTVLAPLIAPSLGLSVSSVGVYVALVYIGAMVSSVLSGPVIGALGGIRVSQIGLLLCAIGVGLMGTSMVTLAGLGALCIGIGYGPLTPASSDVLIRATPPSRVAFVYSLKQTGVPLGGVIAGAALPALTLALGWQWSLVCVGAACCVCLLAAAPFRHALDGPRGGRIHRPHLNQILAPVRFTLADANLRILAVASFVFSATQVSLTAYLVTFLTQGLHWHLVAAGAVLSVSQAAGAFGRVFWGWLADTGVGSKRTMILLAAAMAASAMTVLLVDASTPHGWVLLLMTAFGLTAVGWNGVFLAAVARLAPDGQTAFVTGGTLAFTYLGVVIGPPLFGALAVRVDSFAIAFAALAVPLALCGVFLLRLTPHGADTRAAAHIGLPPTP